MTRNVGFPPEAACAVLLVLKRFGEREHFADRNIRRLAGGINLRLAAAGQRTLHRLAQIGAVLVAQGLGGEAITIQRIATDRTLHILPVARAIVEAEIAVGAAHHDRATVGATDEDRSEEHTSALQS